MQTIAYKSIASLTARQRQLVRSLLVRSTIILVCWSLLDNLCRADDWMTWPSTYTHDASHGQRVDQFAAPVQPLAQRDPTFRRSGFRHYRSTLQAGNSADNMHIVEQWGAPVVPYEQWRFPFRPYGVPYDAWGPQAPYGILNANIGGPGNAVPFVGGPMGVPPAAGQAPGQVPAPGQMPAPGTGPMQPGYGYPGQAYPGYPQTAPWHTNQGYPNPGYSPPVPGNGFPLSPPYQNQPWFDGNYPVAPPLDTRSDAEFFYTPRRQ